MAAPPIIPGEPEFASWSRGGDAKLSYTFNPVVHLRVLVFHGERADALRAEASVRLPAIGLADLRRLLQSDDPRKLLLGIFAGRELRAHDVIDLLNKLRNHPHERVAAAARASSAAAAMFTRQIESGVNCRRTCPQGRIAARCREPKSCAVRGAPALSPEFRRRSPQCHTSTHGPREGA